MPKCLSRGELLSLLSGGLVVCQPSEKRNAAKREECRPARPQDSPLGRLMGQFTSSSRPWREKEKQNAGEIAAKFAETKAFCPSWLCPKKCKFFGYISPLKIYFPFRPSSLFVKQHPVIQKLFAKLLFFF